RPLQGRLDALARLSADACRRFHSSCLGAGVIVSVAGAIDPEEVRREAADLFAALDQEPAAAGVSVPECEGLSDTRRMYLPPLGGQAHLHLGGLTIRREDPELAALELLGVVLGAGSGLTGRIPRRVRETEGLAYACDVSATSGAGLDRGFSQIHIATGEDRVRKAEKVVWEELDRLLDAGIREREIEEARSFLLGREPFGRETARQWSAILAEAELLALPLDQPSVFRRRLEQTERSEVERMARRFFSPSSLKTTVAKPAVRGTSNGASLTP
ncbi:MAG: insulinase family protein, partial [Acidobacteriota bacterium]|nr:insulinase family protein [Acidobacteriota bacterium]